MDRPEAPDTRLAHGQTDLPFAGIIHWFLRSLETNSL